MATRWGSLRPHKTVPFIKYFRNRLSENDQQISRDKLRKFNLKPISGFRFEYDPFNPQSASLRKLCSVLHTPRWRASNLECPCQVVIRGDRSEPTLLVSYFDGQSLLVKTGNFSLADLVELIQRQTDLHVTDAASPASS
ncbi:hypothetical protein BOX15_Mlig009768g1 [Macrostomum lignano]|uniref:Large ribosomal subunit protein mL53 n=1 Tax=Macrostomum lignano TaxID=282301 RepID=A0A267GZ22_9PLAT|nr:hypothetical protein BOX15_Mlig009768g1 [Macrostomum lignano]